MVHLDTNFLIDALLSGSPQEARLLVWLNSGEPVGISSIAWGEFLCGPLSSVAEGLSRRLLPHTVSLDQTHADTAALLFNATGRRAKSLADCCIAAVAISCNASPATSNLNDFQPMAAHGPELAQLADRPLKSNASSPVELTPHGSWRERWGENL
jgi:predicted nucleic acid-binding protein